MLSGFVVKEVFHTPVKTGYPIDTKKKYQNKTNLTFAMRISKVLVS